MLVQEVSDVLSQPQRRCPATSLAPSPPRHADRPWVGLARLGLVLGGLLTGLAPMRAAIALAVGTPDALPARHAGPDAAVGFQIGRPAPDFTVTTPDGQPITRAALLALDRPFVLYFFATW